MSRGKSARDQKIKITCSECHAKVRADSAEMLATGVFCAECIVEARLRLGSLESLRVSPVSAFTDRPRHSAPSGLPPRKRRDWERRQGGTTA
jgi:late competence protein required for DNA uptake (superfamily II DNA/RNA helicase)